MSSFLSEEFVLPRPYPMVDASVAAVFQRFADFYSNDIKMHVVRHALSAGSSRHEVRLFDDKVVFITANVRMAPKIDLPRPDTEETYIQVNLDDGMRKVDEIEADLSIKHIVNLMFMIMSDLSDFEDLVTKVRAIPLFANYGGRPVGTTSQEQGNLPLPQTRSPGRRQWPEDNWAWDEVNIHGRDRKDVQSEWVQRVDPHRALADIKRSFRYAVDPGRRKKSAD